MAGTTPWRRWLTRVSAVAVSAVGVTAAVGLSAQSKPATPEVTFSKDVAPILQRTCQRCHNPNGGAPMPLTTYEEVRPWAKSIRARITLGPHRGVMPPWYVEKDIGIQSFKEDPSLTDEEIAKVVKWVEIDAPQGNSAEMPRPLVFDNSGKWTIGEPDLILESKEITVAADAPDWWGDMGLIPTGLSEDRYVSAVEVREINDVPKNGPTKTVGGRFVWHHQTYTSIVTEDHQEGDPELAAGSWPIHEVGRNADLFPPEAGRLLAAHSSLSLVAAHIHANGRATTAHLEFGFKFFPTGYKPTYGRSTLRLGNGMDVDVPPNAKTELHTYMTLTQNTKIVAFEPHLHAQGVRMCVEAIWGFNVQTLNCVGYDHNWVTQYVYDDDHAPLLPKGTIIHEVAFLDTSSANKNMADNRNWTGGGRRSVANMFLDLGYSVSLTDEQFQEAMAKRRERMKSRNDFDIGCPICWAPPVPPRPAATGSEGR